jgi:hypothetical protein
VVSPDVASSSGVSRADLAAWSGTSASASPSAPAMYRFGSQQLNVQGSGLARCSTGQMM